MDIIIDSGMDAARDEEGVREEDEGAKAAARDWASLDAADEDASQDAEARSKPLLLGLLILPCGGCCGDAASSLPAAQSTAQNESEGEAFPPPPAVASAASS
jgi:hypothetical protein